MKKHLYLLLFLFSCCKPPVPAPTNIIPQKIDFVVFGAESNSGGQAKNADATLDELAPRPGTKILNNALLKWEPLDIGTNNLIQHNGMVNPELKHSWELQLANKQAAGKLGDTLYIVKTGQGGSIMSQWEVNKPFANIFNSRVRKAIQLLGGKSKFALFYSQGINDLIQPTWNADAWEESTIDRFKYLRETYGDFPIIMTKFFDIPGRNVNELNAAIDNVCIEVSNCYTFETKGFPQDDKYHYSYIGQKRVADSMVAILYRKGYRF